MVRITKDPEVRRNELLDIALGLVQQVGYDVMSVEAVTAAAGVAKGTFYHYFASKEDLRFQLLERLGAGLHHAIASALGTNPGGGAEQLQVFMDAAAAYKVGHFGQFLPLVFLYRRENDSLRHRLHETWARSTRGLLVPIIVAGIETLRTRRYASRSIRTPRRPATVIPAMSERRRMRKSGASAAMSAFTANSAA